MTETKDPHSAALRKALDKAALKRNHALAEIYADYHEKVADAHRRWLLAYKDVTPFLDKTIHTLVRENECEAYEKAREKESERKKIYDEIKKAADEEKFKADAQVQEEYNRECEEARKVYYKAHGV